MPNIPTLLKQHASDAAEILKCRAPAVVFLVALAIRLMYLLQSSANPLFWSPQMDANYHDEWAVHLSLGHWVGSEAFFRAPLYPYFLGIIYFIFGHGYVVPRLIQCVIGSGTCAAVVILGRRVAGPTAGLLAGLICAIEGMLIVFDNELQLPVLELFFGVLSLLALHEALARRSTKLFLTAGFLLGMFAITRPNILVFVLFVLVSSAMQLRRASVSWKLPVAAILAGVIVPILPVTIHNWIASRDFVLISSQGGVNLYIGNNANSDGTTAVVPGTHPTWQGGYLDTIHIAEAAAGHSLKPSQVSGYWTRRALAFMRDSPGLWLSLTLRKFVLFAQGFELGNNESVYSDTWESPLLRALLWSRGGVCFPFGFLVPLAAIGVFATRRSWTMWLYIYGYIACYSASVILFFVSGRHRLPIVPALALLAAAGISWMVDEARSRNWAGVVPATVMGLVCLGLVNHDFYKSNEEGFAKGHFDRAEAWRFMGRLPEAEGEYRAAIKLAPDVPWVFLGFAEAMLSAGKLPEARSLAQQAAELAPDLAEPRALLKRIAGLQPTDASLAGPASISPTR